MKKEIPLFGEFLNEGKINIEGMKFVVNSFFDRQGLAIQFIPSSKSEEYSRNEQVENIMKSMKKYLPDLADLLWFESGAMSAGLTFRIDTNKLNEVITKSLK